MLYISFILYDNIEQMSSNLFLSGLELKFNTNVWIRCEMEIRACFVGLFGRHTIYCIGKKSILYVGNC